MTTANMSVGIDTSTAYESLRKLRADMQAMPHNLLISVDPTSVDQDIQRYLKQRTFKISVNTKALGSEIANDVGIALDRAFEKSDRKFGYNQAALRGSLNSAVNEVFSDKERRLRFDRERLVTDLRGSVDGALAYQHTIAINGAALTAQVREAVAAGLVGGVVRVGGVAPVAGAPAAPQGLGPDLNTVLQRALAPAVNELSQAALQIASVARKAGLSQAAGGPAMAKESVSTKDPVSGFTTSFSRRLENPELQLANIQVANQSKALTKQQAEEDARSLATRGALVNQRVVEVGRAEAAVTEALVRSEARIAATRASLVDQRISEVGKAEVTGLKALAQAEKRIADTRASLVNQKVTEVGRAEALAVQEAAKSDARIAATKAALVNQRVAEVGKTEATGIKALAEAEQRIAKTQASLVDQRVAEVGKAEAEKLKAEALSEARMATSRASLVDQRVAEVGKGEAAAIAAEVKSQAQVVATRTALTNQRVSEIGTIEKQGLESQKAALIAYYEKAKFEASKQFTGQGPSIVAAQQTSAKFGTQATVDFLGPKKGYLLDATNEVENYRRKVEGLVPSVNSASASHRTLTAELNQAQQAGGRLAGSLGGVQQNIIPLIAAASAVGFALKSIFTVGKDLEYQLAFVSALSNGAKVSITDFAAATQNSLVGPVKAAEAMRGLAQNGLSVKESLQALPTILNLATAGEMTLTAASLGATGVMAAFNLTVADLGRVSDVFTKAAAISNTSVDEMVNAMKQASTISDVYKVSLEDTAAALAILAQRNIRGTAAGTAYRNMWAELVTPTKAASETLKALGIEAFDPLNHTLKESSVVLDDLHKKIATLNEESRLNVIRDVFGKKGEKAANSILSDYEEYQRMKDKITNESAGFSQSIVDALNQTATGKFKALFNQFELTAATTFINSSNSVKNFADSLRQLAGSQQFAKDLNTLTEAVVNLTKFVVEHGVVILSTLAIWKATGWAIAAVEAFRTIRVAMAATEASAIALGVASRAALGWMTGGIGLVIALGVEYFLLRDKTDAATESQRAYNNSLAAESASMQASTKAIEGRVALLQQQIKYQQQGKSLTEARELADADAPSNKVKSLDAEIARAKQGKADLETALTNIRITGKGKDNAFAGLADEDKIKIQIDQQSTLLNSLYTARNSASVNANAASIENEANYQAKRLEQINTFNRRVRDALKEDPKLKLGQLTIGADQAPAAKDEFSKFMSDRDSEFNKNARNLPKRDKAAEREARALDKSDIKDAIQDIHNLEAEEAQYAKFRKDLDAAKYNPTLFGTQAAAMLAEQRELGTTTELIRIQEAAVKRLKDLITPGSGSFKANLDPVDKKGVERDIKTEEDKLTLARRNQANQADIARAKAQTDAQIEDNKFSKTAAELSGKSAQGDKALMLSYSVKVEDPGSAAASKAAAAVEKEYSLTIIALQESINNGRALENKLIADKIKMESLGVVNPDELDSINAAIAATEKQSVVEQARLATLRTNMAAEARAAGTLGKSLYDSSQTAEYGWNKFWEQYRSQAESSAKQVEDIMKSTTTKMGDAFATFATTGKGDFKSLVNSIIADAARIQSNKWISTLLDYGLRYFDASSGGTTTTGGSYSGTGIGGQGASTPQAGFAKGGIMTSMGPMEMRRYATGGIAHGPQVSVHGEGSLPEANVPLQDGRTIPVTLSGSQAPVVHMPITIVNRTGTQVKPQTQPDGNGGMLVILDAVRSKLGSEIDNGSGLGTNIQNRYGLNNAAGLMR